MFEIKFKTYNQAAKAFNFLGKYCQDVGDKFYVKANATDKTYAVHCTSRVSLEQIVLAQLVLLSYKQGMEDARSTYRG